jgi:hypothetical protein
MATLRQRDRSVTRLLEQYNATDDERYLRACDKAAEIANRTIEASAPLMDRLASKSVR